ncbi:MAG: hypothetical protein R2704_03085 [Microthrixaceae bacterium]
MNLPIGIAEVGWGGPTAAQPKATVATGCRDDLLSLDGRPIGLEIEASTEDLLDRRPVAIRSCDPGGDGTGDETTIELGPEPSLLRTGRGLSVGVDIDELWLRSAAGGRAVDPDAADRNDAAPSAPETTTRRTSRLTYEASVNGATEPYWVVMGQSFNAGWSLRTADGTDLGPPTLVNGYANGWLVDPSEVGADAGFIVEWTPQRTVWIALVLSLIGVLATIAMALFDPAWLGGHRNLAAARVSRVTPLGPLDRFGAARPVPRAAMVGLAAALAGVGAFGLPVGLLAGVVTFAVLARPAAWPLVRVLGIGGYALGSLFVVGKQLRNSYELGFEWPNLFAPAHVLVLISLAMLAVDVLVEGLLGGWRRTVDGELPPGDER